jgi:hypothetical protein
MNNPITDAITGLANNAAGLISGTNPLFAPQITNLFGFNIPAVPLISARDYFLTQMESWVTSIPLRTQWVVLIDRYPAALNTKILQGLELIGGDKKGWDISTPVSILKSYPLQRVIGCLFASSVTIPPETLDTEYINVKNNRGFQWGLISAERQKYQFLRIGFRETNTSFLDTIVRPWIILASHMGFSARPGDKRGARDYYNVKTDVTILQYAASYSNISMIPRKVWTFYNCVPVTLSDEEVVYDPNGEVLDVFQTSWAFSHYTVHPSLYFPLVNVIKRIEQGSVPTISPIQGGTTGGFGSINPFGFI